MTPIIITKDTDWEEIIQFVGNSDSEFLLVPKTKPVMTQEEALAILMSELQKGLDSGPPRDFEEFAKEYGI
ncbi:MAG: hypothetical protein FWB72_05095 [Firmicutes bacterium]|nr:hypothetical protein [Bacillota bacterium]